jgi:hypothetical protein
MRCLILFFSVFLLVIASGNYGFASLQPTSSKSFVFPQQIVSTPDGSVTIVNKNSKNDSFAYSDGHNINLIVQQGKKRTTFKLKNWPNGAFTKHKFYQIDNDYVVPIYVNYDEGNAATIYATYIIVINKNSIKVFHTKSVAGDFNVVVNKNIIKISAFSSESIIIRHWSLYKGSLVREKNSTPKLPFGFRMLPTKTTLHAKSNFGSLQFKLGEYKIPNEILFNKERISKVNSYNGFFAKTLNINGKNIVIADIYPDHAAGNLFQIFELDPNNIRISRAFGVSYLNYPAISYKISGNKLYLDVLALSRARLGKLSIQRFEYANHTIEAISSNSRVHADSNHFWLRSGSINLRGVSHVAMAAAPLPRWYAIDQVSFKCVPIVDEGLFQNPLEIIHYFRGKGDVTTVKIAHATLGNIVTLTVQPQFAKRFGMQFFSSFEVCRSFLSWEQNKGLAPSVGELK